MKEHAPVLFLGVLLIVILGLFGVVRVMAGPEINPQSVACTQEAKICPDGSAVGRTGPNCEFPACPESAVIATSTPTSTPVAYECSQDAKICPDGSTVGRTGAKCEFTKCPEPTATSGTIQTSIGQKMTALNITITPLEVTEDSRCPKDVQCIWAGTVKVRARLSSGLGTSEEVFGLNTPITTEAEEVTLVDVSPLKAEGETVPVSSYRFTFEVNKR